MAGTSFPAPRRIPVPACTSWKRGFNSAWDRSQRFTVPAESSPKKNARAIVKWLSRV